MKKRILFQLILLMPFLSMGFTSPPAMIHPPIDGNWLDPMQQGLPSALFGPTVYIFLDENDNLNLQLIATTTDNLMEEYDELHIRWTVGNQSDVMGPITENDMIAIEGGYYQAIEIVTIEFAEDCSAGPRDYLPADILLELVTPKAEGFDVYPMENNEGLFDPNFYNGLNPTLSTSKTLLCWGATPPSNLVGNDDLSVKSSSVKKVSPIQESPLNQEIESDDDDDDDIIQGISVYPNPFSNSFKLQYYLEEASDVRLRIFDVHGSLIQNKTFRQQSSGAHTQSFSFEDNLSSGLYLIHLYYEDRMHAIKLMRI